MKINDFSKGPVWKNIVVQAVPLTIAQLFHLLYNLVDRIYIGHIGDGNSLALAGVGLTFPLITMIMAFSALFGNGGVPLFSMERGRGDDEKAARILGNSFALLLVTSVVMIIIGYAFCEPILYAFGASNDSIGYAMEYMRIYLLGTTCSMVSTGMNGYISAQGFPKIVMISVILGGIANVILDPIFIFKFNMGVAGAAYATIISQTLSAIWVLYFLFGKNALVPLRVKTIRIDGTTTRSIFSLGLSNFIMQGTTCLVQVACNSTLQTYGGDIYVSIMTVINSVREVFMLPVSGIVNGSMPVISYNYGAKEYDRVKSGIRFNTFLGSGYTLMAWAVVMLFPRFWFRVFTDDLQMMEIGIIMLRTYFGGFVFMALQFAGQSTFQALGRSKQAIFFALFRKAAILVPLTVLLPRFGAGIRGAFMGEPISNVIGGTICFLTMYFTIYRKMDNL